MIAAQGLDLTEDEYALLVGVCSAEGARWEAAAQLLARMSRELTVLQPSTLAAIEALFRCAQSITTAGAMFAVTHNSWGTTEESACAALAYMHAWDPIPKPWQALTDCR